MGLNHAEILDRMIVEFRVLQCLDQCIRAVGAHVVLLESLKLLIFRFLEGSTITGRLQK